MYVCMTSANIVTNPVDTHIYTCMYIGTYILHTGIDLVLIFHRTSNSLFVSKCFITMTKR